MLYDYNVEYVKTFDRNKSYYSHHYKSAFIKLDNKYTCYNIATQYSKDTQTTKIFIVFYTLLVPNSIKLNGYFNGAYKIYFKDLLPNLNKDYNIDVKYIESRNNPDCDIYEISGY